MGMVASNTEGNVVGIKIAQVKLPGMQRGSHERLRTRRGLGWEGSRVRARGRRRDVWLSGHAAPPSTPRTPSSAATAASSAPDRRGLMKKPHAPFDGAEPTSPNLKRRPWRGVGAPQKLPTRTRAPLARRLARSAPGGGRGFGPAAGALPPVLPPGLRVPAGGRAR